jgi:hypothetical protein
MKKLAIVALATVAALAACAKEGENAGGGDSTAVITDTTGAMPAPMAAPATPADTTMAPAPGTMTDSAGGMGGMTDTTGMDTTKKM